MILEGSKGSQTQFLSDLEQNSCFFKKLLDNAASPSGGNQVDGSLPARHTEAAAGGPDGVIRVGAYRCSGNPKLKIERKK